MADKLKDLHFDLDAGVQTSASYTVEQAVADWMREGRDGRSPSTGLAGNLAPQPLAAGPGAEADRAAPAALALVGRSRLRRGPGALSAAP